MSILSNAACLSGAPLAAVALLTALAPPEAVAATADAVRLVVLEAPKGLTPAVTEFTVFGSVSASRGK